MIPQGHERKRVEEFSLCTKTLNDIPTGICDPKLAVAVESHAAGAADLPSAKLGAEVARHVENNNSALFAIGDISRSVGGYRDSTWRNQATALRATLAELK